MPANYSPTLSSRYRVRGFRHSESIESTIGRWPLSGRCNPDRRALLLGRSKLVLGSDHHWPDIRASLLPFDVAFLKKGTRILLTPRRSSDMAKQEVGATKSLIRVSLGKINSTQGEE